MPYSLTGKIMSGKKQVRGRIILFQEERIRLVDDQGRSFLLDLSNKLPVTSEKLRDWINAGTKLDVSYEGDPETETGIARSIKAAA